MQKLRNRSRTYYQYLSSYLALLLVGIIALVALFEGYFVVSLRDNLMEIHQNILEQSSQRLDNEIKQLLAIDYQLTSVNENFFSYYLMPESPRRDLKIIHELRNLKSTSSFVDEIALCDPNLDVIYTATAAYDKTVFFDTIFHYEDWESPAQTLSQITRRTVRPAERINGGKHYITFINPPSVFSRLGTSLLIFFIPASACEEILAPDDGQGRQGAILNQNHELLLSSLPITSGQLDEKELTLDGTHYLILKESSTVMDWTYYALFDRDVFMMPVYRLNTLLCFVLLFVMLLGFLFIRYFMRVNYRPLQRLTHALGTSEKGNELESLSNAIQALSVQNETFRRQLMSSPDGQALKDALLFSLLKHKFSSFEEFNREGASLGMHFEKPCYQVLLLRHFDKEYGDISRSKLQAAFDTVWGEAYTCYFRELFEPSMFVCLVGMEIGQEEKLAQDCERLIQWCAQEHALSFTIGASRCYQSIDPIATACFEANQAVQEYFLLGRHRLIRYADIMTRSIKGLGNPLNLLRDLEVKSPEERTIAVSQFFERLKENQFPSQLAKSYCNYAVQQLVSMPMLAENMTDLFAISYLRTVDDYQAFMLRLLKTAEPTQSEPANGENGLFLRITAYIGEHYDNCNFSVQEAADALHISASYLSQYFKQQSGDTLTGYVSTLRIQKARTLLETTTMPLQMVSESIGYYNLNSFIRRFKQVTGVTPGEYRHGYQ